LVRICTETLDVGCGKSVSHRVGESDRVTDALGEVSVDSDGLAERIWLSKASRERLALKLPECASEIAHGEDIADTRWLLRNSLSSDDIDGDMRVGNLIEMR
jgi:hypothetical protein